MLATSSSLSCALVSMFSNSHDNTLKCLPSVSQWSIPPIHGATHFPTLLPEAFQIQLDDFTNIQFRWNFVWVAFLNPFSKKGCSFTIGVVIGQPTTIY